MTIKVSLIVHNGLVHPALSSDVRTVYFDVLPTTDDLSNALDSPEDRKYQELLAAAETPNLSECDADLAAIGLVTLTCTDDSEIVIGAIVLEVIDVLPSTALQVG